MRKFPERVGGRLSLDFVNTVDPRTGSRRVDYLPDFASVLDWFEVADVPLPQSIRRLRRQALRDEGAADQAHAHVVEMRESLNTVISSAIAGSAVRPADLARVNVALGESIGHRVLAPAERGGVREEWRTSDVLEQVLWPIAIDAWDLLTEPELADVKQCPVDVGGCGWLFLDVSRSRNRRWCDMRTCGNRAKVRAHYSRRSG